jgi:hypothetical protein
VSRPEPRLITQILGLTAVKTLGLTAIYPLKIPQGKPYPGVVYQVIRDWPEDDSSGRAAGHHIRIRITCLAQESTGAPGYAAVRAMASAIEGDSNPNPATLPSGIAGWKDGEGNVWRKLESFDEMGSVVEGSDQFEAYGINIVFETAYSNV